MSIPNINELLALADESAPPSIEHSLNRIANRLDSWNHNGYLQTAPSTPTIDRDNAAIYDALAAIAETLHDAKRGDR